MKIDALRHMTERVPFRPFTVRISNGAQYAFREPREFGAPRDLHVICYFGDTHFVLIDPDQIVEVIDAAA